MTDDANPGATTFLACNALTNEVIAEIPYATGHYARILNDAGILEATVALDAPGIAFASVAVPGTVMPAYVAAVIADNPLGFWRLNETSGLVAKDTMGLHDGTYNMDPTAYSGGGGLTTGPVDPSALMIPYNASGPYYGMPNQYMHVAGGWRPAVFTFEIWAYLPVAGESPSGFIMASHNDSYMADGGHVADLGMNVLNAQYNTAGTPNNSTTGTGTLSQMSISAGWHYIVATQDATHQVMLYIDGVLFVPQYAWFNGLVTPAPGNCDLTVGQLGIGGGYDRPFWGGAVAEAAVYGYALTAGQVAAHYAARSGFIVTATREQTGGLVADGAVEPCAVSIYALRDGVIEWGGLLWGHVYDITSGILSLTAAEFGSYLAYRYLTSDALYTGDISTLAADWVAAACADGGFPVAIAATPAATDATLQTFAYEQHNVLDLVKAYSAIAGGYDYAFDTEVDGNGNPSALLTISWPRRGRTAAVSEVVIDVPGMATAMTLAKDGTRFATEALVTGAGSGPDQISAVVSRPQPGYLKLQVPVNDPDITTTGQATLTGEGWLDALATGAPLMPVLTMDGADFFALGVTVGDEVSLALDLPYFLGSLPIRILAYDVTPQNGTSGELVALTLGAPL